MSWGSFLLGGLLSWLVTGIGGYFLRKDLERQLQIARDACDAFSALQRIDADIAKSDVDRWKCVALGTEWTFNAPLSPERELQFLRARMDELHRAAGEKEEHA